MAERDPDSRTSEVPTGPEGIRQQEQSQPVRGAGDSPDPVHHAEATETDAPASAADRLVPGGPAGVPRADDPAERPDLATVPVREEDSADDPQESDMNNNNSIKDTATRVGDTLAAKAPEAVNTVKDAAGTAAAKIAEVTPVAVKDAAATAAGQVKDAAATAQDKLSNLTADDVRDAADRVKAEAKKNPVLAAVLGAAALLFLRKILRRR